MNVKPLKPVTFALLLMLSACQGKLLLPPASVVWQPDARVTFQLQLQSTLEVQLNSNVAPSIYIIDLFDNTEAKISQLKRHGHKVVCYFSAGSSENWRPDFNSFMPGDKGRNLSGWKGEKWLDIRSHNVRKIMLTRMDIAAQKGCDGVDADNVDGFRNHTGFKLTGQDQLEYNRFLSSQAHSRGLAIGLKNDETQLSELANSFEFAVNEQCHEYGTCAAYKAFTSIGKPVLNIEYQSIYVQNKDGVFTTTPAFTKLCALASAHNLTTQVLPIQLDGSYRFTCN